MPNFGFYKALDIARDVKAFLTLKGGLTRGAVPASERHGGRAKKEEHTQRRTAEKMEEIKSKERELRNKRQESRRIRNEERAAKDGPLGIEHKRSKKKADMEVFRLERELRAAREGWPEDEPVTGALPDFLVIGAMKGGTTFLYHLLGQHPLVEPAAAKEPHFFDNLYDEGVEWYRQNFPTPRHKDGRTTITGEATPFMFSPQVPERVARLVPRARLIALLRNPVDRAYSSYQQMVRRGGTTRTFEEVIEEEKALLLAPPQLHGYHREEYLAAADDEAISKGLIDKGLYVDHLLRWSEHFDREQMLVLKSEDFFGSPQRTLRQTYDYLGRDLGW